MTDKSPTTEPQEKPLDDRTEMLIANIANFAAEHGHPKVKSLPEECSGCETQKRLLRERIRELQEEARIKVNPCGVTPAEARDILEASPNVRGATLTRLSQIANAR